MVAVRRNSAASDVSFLIPLSTFFNGQIHRTENKSRAAAMACRFLDHPNLSSGKIIRPACTGRKVRDASNPITRSPSAKSRSFAINTACWKSNSAAFSKRALHKRGVTGETLLQLLETRLDNVVFRLGLANTRSAARQLVSHGHVQVNGRNVNIASYNVKAGDEVTVKDKPKSRQLALRNLELTQIAPVPDWLVADRDALSGKVSRIPTREEMQPMVNEQLIVELYSR